MTDQRNQCWFLAPDHKAADAVQGHAESLLSTYGRKRRQWMALMSSVYLNEDPASPADTKFGWLGPSRYPVTQGGIDSVHSKLALSRPRPKILPSSRRFKAKRQAKTLQRWVDGLWKKQDTEAKQDTQLFDAMVYGAGVIKVVGKHGGVCHERRHPGDILTDPREERRSNVRSLFEIAAVDREVLAESDLVEGTDMRAKILSISAPAETDDPTVRNETGVTLDQLKVIEAWRLPNSPDSPGRHIMVVGNLSLIDEDWEWDCFPFSILPWGRAPERMWGQGMVERGLGVQSMLTHHSFVLDDSMERFVPKYAVARGAGVDLTVINKRVGQAIEYDNHPTGGPPTVLTPSQVSPEFMGYHAELANRWFAITGSSQMDARSEADPSLESGKAKLIQGDINSGRFYDQGKNRERACIKLAELSIRMADLLHEQDEGETEESAYDSGYSEPPDMDDEDHPLDVPADRTSWRERIPYKVARMSGKGDEAYAIEVWPVSTLSQSIAGRMEEVAQLEAAGHITDKAQSRELLNIPVLDDFQDLESAKREAAEREIDKCLDGEQGTPSTYMDLIHAVEHARKELCLAGIEDAPQEVLEMLRVFIGAAEAMLQKQMAQQAPPTPAPPMGPVPVDPMAAA